MSKTGSTGPIRPSSAAAAPRRGRRAGFSLMELLMASTLGVVVLPAVIVAFVWAGRQVTLCGRIGASHTEAMLSSAKIAQYVRNAAQVADVDRNEGAWVDLTFPAGGTERLAYRKPGASDAAGLILLVRSNGNETVVAEGVTEMQEPTGFNTPIFTQTGTNAVRVAYRVATPGEPISKRGPYAVSVQFAVCLRNAPL